MAWTEDGKWIPDQQAAAPVYQDANDNDQGTAPGPAPTMAPGTDKPSTSGFFDGIKNLIPSFGGQTKQQLTPDVGMQSLRDMGIPAGSPEERLLQGLYKSASSMQGPPARYAGMQSTGGELAAALAHTGAAYFNALGQFKDPTAHVRDAVNNMQTRNNSREDSLRNAYMKTTELGATMQGKRIDDDRTRARNAQNAKDFEDSLNRVPGAAVAPQAAAGGQALAGTSPGAQQAPAGIQVTQPTAGPGTAVAPSGAPAMAPSAAQGDGSPMGRMMANLKTPAAQAHFKLAVSSIGQQIGTGNVKDGATIDKAYKEAVELDNKVTEMTPEYMRSKSQAEAEGKAVVADTEAKKKKLATLGTVRNSLNRLDDIARTEGVEDAIGPLQGTDTYQKWRQGLPLANPKAAEMHTEIGMHVQTIQSVLASAMYKGEGPLSEGEREMAARIVADFKKSTNPVVMQRLVHESRGLIQKILTADDKGVDPNDPRIASPLPIGSPADLAKAKREQAKNDQAGAPQAAAPTPTPEAMKSVAVGTVMGDLVKTPTGWTVVGSDEDPRPADKPTAADIFTLDDAKLKAKEKRYQASKQKASVSNGVAESKQAEEDIRMMLRRGEMR